MRRTTLWIASLGALACSLTTSACSDQAEQRPDQRSSDTKVVRSGARQPGPNEVPPEPPRKALNEPCNRADECVDELVCVESKCRTTRMADCFGGSGDACVAVANRSDDDDTKREYLGRGCARDHATSCGELGDLLHDSGEEAEAFEAYMSGCGRVCSDEECRYCFNAAILSPTDNKKIEHARTGCDGGHLGACRVLGRALFTADDLRPGARKEALTAWEKACDGGDQESCDLLDIEGVYPSYYLFAEGSTRSSTSLDVDILPFVLRCFHLTATYERYTIRGARRGDTFDLTAEVDWSGLRNDYTTSLRFEGRYGQVRVRVRSDDALMPAYRGCDLTDWTAYEDIPDVINEALEEQRAKAAKTGVEIGKVIFDLLSD